MKWKWKREVKAWGIDLACDFIGSGIYALGVNMFTAPANIAPGGVTGIATLINYVIGAPLGTISLCINIPLLLLSFLFLGRKTTAKTLKSVLVLSVMLNSMAGVPPYTDNTLLAALFGGVCMGGGLAVIFMRGGTTGGTDIVAQLLQLRFPFLPIGRLMMSVDVVILTAAVLVYGKLEAALYGLIAIFALSRVLDSVLYGLDVGKMVMVVSEQSREIAKRIHSDMDRGATLLSGKGSYSEKDKLVLMVAVRRNEFHLLKKLVYEVDPRAFVIVSEAGEILGEGFKPPNGRT